jgi:DNA-binding response OmpR family regulator
LTKRILVVEDDDAIRHVVSDALLDAGFAVATATDGNDALDQLGQHPADAMLLDLTMPSMDGWSLLRICRSDDALAGLPIGILSAAPQLHRTADAWGVQVAIGKPFALEHLVEQVEHLVDPVRMDELTGG